MVPRHFAARAVLLFLALSLHPAFAQETDTSDATAIDVAIETTSGGTVSGRVLQQDANTITVHDASFGTVTLERKNIARIEYRDPSRYRDGRYWFDNPAATRYLLGPTAWPLGDGEGYYQNTYLVLNTFFYGAGDHLVIGGGFEILTMMAGSPIFFFMPKIGVPLGEHTATGGGVAIAMFEGEFSGIGYGLLTLGDRDDNVTFGLGYGLSDGESLEQPIYTISGMLRASRSVSFVTENWFVPDNGRTYSIFSYGIRFLGESLSVDVAFLNNAEIAEHFALGIPYVSLMVRF